MVRARAPWLSVTGGASATGTGMVVLSIAANSGPARQGVVMIADQTVTVTPPALDAPSPAPVPAESGPFAAAATEPGAATQPGAEPATSTEPGTTTELS